MSERMKSMIGGGRLYISELLHGYGLLVMIFFFEFLLYLLEAVSNELGLLFLVRSDATDQILHILLPTPYLGGGLGKGLQIRAWHHEGEPPRGG